MIRTCIVKQLIALFLLFIFISQANASNCTPWVAKAISIQGNVERRLKTESSTSSWQPIKRDDVLCEGEIVRVKQNSRAALILKNDTILRLNQNTTITLSGLTEDQSHWINLEQGIAHFIARIKQSFKVITPFVNAAVEGTEFVVSVNDTRTEITVFEGIVNTSNLLGEVKLIAGQTAITVKDFAPAITLKVKPRDAVQWSLYYPAVIDFNSAFYQDLKPDSKNIMDRSIAAAKDGQFTTALKQIGLISDADLNTLLLTYRASLYLSVGQIENAKQDIQQVTQKQPENAEAAALQAIITLVQNDKTHALSLAKQAATLAPDSATTALALSFVYQSLFDINNALQIIKTAATKNKDNALLWSRLSELNLMVGALNEALKAAKQANYLNPNIARTFSTLGFAYLSRIEVKKAEQAFKNAIERNDTDPLSRLGLGLAIIRQGNLAEGRQQIEFAATLDPNNALIRSYLGKAYYEEKRDELAETQYEMAKQLDPNDPTAFYYDAIRKQSINRSIEALQDLEKSIELNEYRAVYQSQLKLDQDEAARSASLARIYNDVGFGQLGLREGLKSVNNDPTNSSAHRFLADTYSSLQRHEIARVSELLQAQLLQPLNLNPVQPQLAESNLGILDGTGPSESTFTEFNPMFTRNRIGLQLNAVGGNQGTKGDDLVISGLYDNFSYSFGQFHYETNGFRANNDLKHDIYNAFFQLRVSSNFNIQAEINDKKTVAGDLLFQFNPNIFKPNKRQSNDAKTRRIGFHYQPSSQHNLIGSFYKQNRDEEISDSQIFSFPGFDVLSENIVVVENKSLSSELQYIYNLSYNKIIIGAGIVDLKRKDITTTTQSALPPAAPNINIDMITKNFDTKNSNIYIYNIFKPISNIFIILGLSYDTLEKQKYKNDILNSKLGVQIDINKKTLIRIAAFSAVKRPLFTNQTIEPTNVVGFNQFFDDIDGTKSKRYGAAIEHQFSTKLNTGLELSWRKLDVPIVTQADVKKFDEFDEQIHRGYLYWIINKNTSMTIEYSIDYLYSAPKNLNPTPTQLKTRNLPMGINYTNSNGLSTKLIFNFVKQDYEDSNNEIQKEDFLVTNVSASYRFPKRMGTVSIGINNLFNEKFNYYNLEITGEPRPSVFQPLRTIFTKFSLSF